jgi:hypothetical protein
MVLLASMKFAVAETLTLDKILQDGYGGWMHIAITVSEKKIVQCYL